MMKTLRKILDILARRGWSATLVVLAILALGFTWSSSEGIIADVRLFDRIAIMVDRSYVEAVDRAKLIKAGVDGMLSKLDKYTRYLEGGDYIYLQQTTDGKLEGVGIYLDIHRDTLTVTSVVKSSPGHKVGIKPGDRLMAIDSLATDGLDLSEVRMLMNGPIGSPITLRILRPGQGEYQVTTTRDEVDIEAIPYYAMISDQIGLVKLVRFSEGCTTELRTAIEDLRRKGMKSLILDLRENPGGLLGEAIGTASLFLPENAPVVETRGRDGELIASYPSYGDPAFLDGDLAVIIDSHTASAAEIVAGAIQDHDRGVIIGSESYGKGLIQQVLSVNDSSALKITTSRYHLPSGRCLQKPDWTEHELAVDRETDISDSMYATIGGRPVLGGGGIVPDVYVEEEQQSVYIEALRRESCFFDFVTAYINENEIEPGFEIDDEIISQFRQFISARGFRFQDEDRLAFDSLRIRLKSSDSATDEAMAIIDRQISSREDSYFESNRDAVAGVLREEIILQRFDEREYYESSLKEQPQVAEAMKLLSDSREYASVFAAR